jgi:hypothetical protein
MLRGEATNLYFYLTGAQNHDLPLSRQAHLPLGTDAVILSNQILLQYMFYIHKRTDREK